MGLLDGATTNPSLVAKEKRSFRDLVDEICRIVDGPVSLEVVATDTDGMVQQGRELAKIAPNVVVKLPTTVEGLKALRILRGEGLRTNLTLCFSASQALLVAKGGATYVSPFLGRLDDISHVGMDLIRTIRKIYDNYGFETQILAASLRNPLHVVDAALAGRGRGDPPVRRLPAAHQAPADRHRPQALPRRLAEGRRLADVTR